MSFARFLVQTCVVFVLVGPLVPMTVVGVEAAVSTGAADRLLAPVALAPLSYFFGSFFAFKYVAACAASLFAVAWRWPSLTRARAVQRLAAALCTGFGVTLALQVSFLWSRYQSMVSNPFLRNQDWKETLASLWRLEASNFATLFLVPTSVCICVVALILLPKLAANPSIERTVAGKPAPAAHVER